MERSGPHRQSDRWTTDETHGAGSGPRNYFARDGVSAPVTPMPEARAGRSHGGLLRHSGPSRTAVASGLVLTADPTLTQRSPFLYGTLLAGETSTHPITLEGGTTLFAAQWKSGTLLMTLMSPSGQVIDPAYAAAHPETVTFQESEGYAVYHSLMPPPAPGKCVWGLERPAAGAHIPFSPPLRAVWLCPEAPIVPGTRLGHWRQSRRHCHPRRKTPPLAPPSCWRTPAALL